jgi:hypothetical protein
VLDPFEPDSAPVFAGEATLVEVVLVDVELTAGAFVDVGAGTMITAGRVVAVSEFVVGGLVGGVVSGGAVVRGVVAAGSAGCVGFVRDGANGLVVLETFAAVLGGRVTTGRLTVGRDPPPVPPEPQAAPAMIPTSTHASRRDVPRSETAITTQRRARSMLMVLLDSRVMTGYRSTLRPVRRSPGHPARSADTTDPEARSAIWRGGAFSIPRDRLLSDGARPRHRAATDVEVDT